MQPELKFFRGKWCAYWRENGLPQRRSLRTSNRQLAEQRLADELDKLRAPIITCGDIVGLYIEEKEPKVAVPDDLHYAWRQLKPMYESLKPEQCTILKSREYHAQRLSDGVGNATVNRELSVIRAAMNWHDNRGPARFEMLPKPPPRDRYLTRAEFMQLLDGAAAHHIKLFIILALSTAGRHTALLDLTWTRVDFDKGLIRLSVGGEDESKKGRATVPMTETARRALTEAKKAALSPYVIEWAGRRVHSVKKGVARAVQRAGLKDVSPHVLRHTAAVWMAENGSAMSEIAQYLGHSDSRITERVYARYSPEYLAGAATALEL